MARKRKPNLANIAEQRRKEGKNQSEFWNCYGVSQSGGSRYESGSAIPKPFVILMLLNCSGKITDNDLTDALE